MPLAQVWKLGDLDSHRKQGEPVSDITEHYAAPEIATAMLKGANVLADAKMDIFSLGLVAYEVLAGVAFLPTSAFDKDAALRALGGSGLDALLQKQLAPLPQQFKGLLQHMLKVSPGERKRAQELRQDGALTGQVPSRPSPRIGAPSAPTLLVPLPPPICDGARRAATCVRVAGDDRDPRAGEQGGAPGPAGGQEGRPLRARAGGAAAGRAGRATLAYMRMSGMQGAGRHHGCELHAAHTCRPYAPWLRTAYAAFIRAEV